MTIKGFARSVRWNECKSKSENKNTTNEYRNFLESNFVGVNYPSQDNCIKKLIPKDITYQKILSRIINGK